MRQEMLMLNRTLLARTVRLLPMLISLEHIRSSSLVCKGVRSKFRILNGFHRRRVQFLINSDASIFVSEGRMGAGVVFFLTLKDFIHFSNILQIEV